MSGLQKLLSLLPIVIPAWYIGNLLESRWPNIVRILLALAATNTTVVWMLRYQRDWLVGIARTPGISHYLRLVCRCTGEQFPVGSTQHDAYQGLALRTHEEFEAAGQEAQLWVRGQAQAVTTYLRHVRDSSILRQKLTSGGDNRPLSSLLLSGPSGIGKKYLARVLGRLIFLNGVDQAWELEKLGTDQVTALFGSRGTPGPLLASLARQPYQTIVLDNIEAATEPLQDLLRSILQQGMISDPATGRQVSFRNTILIMTTTQCADALRSLSQQGLIETDWHTRAIETLSNGTGLSATLLACVNDFVVFTPPGGRVKAEVLALALQRECGKYGIELKYIDPKLLVQELSLLEGNEGFAILEDRAKKLLQLPLAEAIRLNKRQIILKAKPAASISHRS